MTRMARKSLSLFAILALVTLAGCNTLRIQGRVIEGATSFATIVPENDTRLTEGQSVPGATVTLRTDRGEVLGSGKADASGRFSVGLSDRGSPTSSIQLEGTAPGYLPARADLYLPRDGRRIVVTMKGTGGQTSSGPAE